MLFDLALAAYLGCAGFVAAGILGSFYQLVTGEPPKFALPLGSWVLGVLSFLLCIFVGPFIIMRNAILRASHGATPHRLACRFLDDCRNVEHVFGARGVAVRTWLCRAILE